MKKVFIALTAFALSATAVTSAFSTPSTYAVVADQQDEKVAVKLDELPEAIKTTLAGDSYKGWTAESAMHNKTKNTFEVTVKQGTETKVLKFDADGKSVE